MSEVSGALSRIDLFSELSAKDLERVTAVLERIDGPEGGVVFAEGDASDGVCILLEGTVRIAPCSFREVGAT